MKDDDKKSKLMELLGISNEKIADKVPDRLSKGR